MTNDRLTGVEIRQETDSILEILGWSASKEGIDYHLHNVGTSHPYGVLAGILVDATNYGVDRGWNPAYLIGYLAIRIWGQHPEWREELEKIIPNWDCLDGLLLDGSPKQSNKS